MTSKQIKTHGSESGFSLVEMIVAIAIFSGILFISADSFWKSSVALKNQDRIVSRNRIIHNLLYIMGLPASIRAAMQNEGDTSPIWKCAKGGPCLTGTLKDVSLYLPPIGSNGTDIITSGPISGPPSAPLLYSLTGEVCDPGKACAPADYPISVSTQFDAVCPPLYDKNYGIWPKTTPIAPAGLAIPVKCWNAQYIKVYYKIEPTPGAPNDVQFTPISGTVYVSAVAVRLNR